MYNAWRQQTADVSVIHNYKLTTKNGWNLILIVFYLLGKFKVKGVGWAGKAQMANALSLSQ